MERRGPRWFDNLGLQVLALAAAYYLLGRLALLLALPPGYATPVWPAAGIALAGVLRFGPRVWPGILLGSFALNFPTALDNDSPWLASALVAAAIGAGATLQGVAGAWLVRRQVDAASAFARADAIGKLLILGGPVACLLNASAGVGVLVVNGLVAPGEAAFNWVTWWVGDSIGVLVVLPLFLAWTAAPWQLPLRNKIAASAPVLALLALLTVLFVRTSTLEQRWIEAQFRQRSDQVADNLQREFASYSEALHALATFEAVAGAAADRAAFATMVDDILRRHPELSALSWSPRVDAAGRRVGEQAAAGTSAGRTDHFPIASIEPRARNAAALGFDLASDPGYRAAMLRAARAGRPIATRWADPARPGGARDAVLLLQPAWRAGAARGTPQQREQAVDGYAGAVLRVSDMLLPLLEGRRFGDLQIRLEDLAAPAAHRVMLDQLPPQRDGHAPLQEVMGLEFGGRPWRVTVQPRNGEFAGHRSWVAWSMLALGMLFTGLFSAFLLVTIGRTAAVRGEVRRRTGELRKVNAALEQSVAEHASASAALRASEAQARSIIETARDAYVCVDANSMVLEWNGEAERTFGWTRAEAVGQPLAELFIPETHRNAHGRGIERYLATGEAPVLNQRIELPAMRRDGTQIPVELIIWATESVGEYRFHAFLHDITARRRAHQRLAAQEAAAAALVMSPGLAQAAPRVLATVCSELGWEMGTLWLADAENTHLYCAELWRRRVDEMSAFATITRETRFASDVGLPGRVWASGKPLWIPDVTLDENFPRAPFAARDDLHAAFAVPLNSGGETMGVLEFFSHRIEQPDEGLLRMMDTLGSLFGEYLARKRAEAALFEEKELAQVTLRSIGDGVVVIDTEGRITYLNPIAENMTGWTAEEALGKPVLEVLQLVDHETGKAGLNPLLLALHENRVLGLALNSDLVRRDGFRAPIEDSAAPIHDRSGNVIGSVMVFHDVSESRAMALKMSHLAQHDYLTDLPNRVLLQDRFEQAIERARREGLSLALLYMDLDGFKHINDSLGHEVGDKLLQAVAHRLETSIRSVDTVSRQGGDEFVVLLPEIRSGEDAARVAEHILQAARRPFKIGGAELNVTLSIGISLFPDDGDNPGALLKYADAAMYQAKQHGRDRYRFYTRAISERADRRLAVESSLHQALRNDEFVLHYQPLVAPESGAITGMEALVRWQPRDGELRYPGEFIEIAEESGLVARIDLWVMEAACRQNRAWQEAGMRALPVSVNLSATHTDADQFHRQLRAILQRTGLDPSHLHVEITERQMLHDTERFTRLIHGIKATGAKVAIDDFGTGYSSLGYLSSFPFDVLKIDRTFVSTLEHDPKAVAIVAAITQLAHALGYVVVAEGVETASQASILHAQGCHEMQGYLYSRPVAAEAFAELLRAGRLKVPLDPPHRAESTV